MEAEREKFRAYIESSGLMSALTNVLVTLYEEPNKPEDALKYTMDALAARSGQGQQIKLLEEKCRALESEVKELKEKLATIEKSSKIEETS